MTPDMPTGANTNLPSPHPERTVANVTVFDNGGGGFATTRPIYAGVNTIGEVFAALKPNSSPANFTILVNGSGVAADTILNGGETISITPNKIAGA